MKEKFSKVKFPKKKNLGKRNWGSEDLLVLISKVLSLKLLKIKKGKKGGLQYHHKKNECGYLLKGRLKIKYDDGEGKLKSKIINAGKSFHFPPGAVHQEIALSNCTIIEASTPHFNDRVRVETKYGMKEKKGLKKSLKREVVLR